jgi:hypothetical protein
LGDAVFYSLHYEDDTPQTMVPACWVIPHQRRVVAQLGHAQVIAGSAWQIFPPTSLQRILSQRTFSSTASCDSASNISHVHAGARMSSKRLSSPRISS